MYLHWGESVIFQERQPDDRHQQELHTERVVLRVVFVPEAHVDQVHGSIGQSQEHHLRAQSHIHYWSCKLYEIIISIRTKDMQPVGGCLEVTAA